MKKPGIIRSFFLAVLFLASFGSYIFINHTPAYAAPVEKKEILKKENVQEPDGIDPDVQILKKILERKDELPIL